MIKLSQNDVQNLSSLDALIVALRGDMVSKESLITLPVYSNELFFQKNLSNGKIILSWDKRRILVSNQELTKFEILKKIP
jgi:hypothetical protein